MKIYMIRHGRQSSTLCNVDVSLCDAGHEQAKLVGKRLVQYGIDGLYSSHLTRAKQTAAHIADALSLPVTYVDHIEEIHFGDWTGKTEEELNAQYAQDRKAYYQGSKDILYPNGENGQICFERYEKGFMSMIEMAQKQDQNAIAVVTHGIAMRAFLCGVLGIDFAKRGTLAKTFENCSITQLNYEDGVFYLERFNDYAHLEPYDELLRKHFK